MAPAFFTTSPVQIPLTSSVPPARSLDPGRARRFPARTPDCGDPGDRCTMAPMKRPVVVIAVGGRRWSAASVLALVRRPPGTRFRRLIADGDAALGRGPDLRRPSRPSAAPSRCKPRLDARLSQARRHLPAARRARRPHCATSAQAATLDPTAPRPLELLGDVNCARRRYDRAVERYRGYLALDDRAPRVLYKLALATIAAGDAARRDRAAPAGAWRSTTGWPKRTTCSASAPLSARRDRRGRRARSNGRSTLNPAFDAAREELADLYAALGRDARRASSSSKRWPRSSRRGPSARRAGLAYARAGRTDTARRRRSARAAERFPTSRRSYTALGRVWLDWPRRRRSRRALSKALEALQPAASARPRRARRWRSTAARCSLATASARRRRTRAASEPSLAAARSTRDRRFRDARRHARRGARCGTRATRGDALALRASRPRSTHGR